MDPLTTALTRSEQSGLTQFLVQFARRTRVSLKPAEMKMDQQGKDRRLIIPRRTALLAGGRC